MRLFEHPDFEQAVLQATEHFREQNLRPAIIEKDYYVTEALRVIANTSGDKVIFKGGTSLAKGWNLIQRFSEDIDIFLDPTAFQPALGKRGIDRELKKLSDAIGGHPALSFEKNESKAIGGFGRNDRFSYTQRFGGPGEVANRVLVEAGAASGREPSEIVQLRSYVGQFLNETGRSFGAEDEGSFPFRLLHFRRTFVEKMFAIHSKVELLKRTKQPLGSYARHYYDLFQLSRHAEVDAMLRSEEYAAIKADYDRISKTHFPRSYFFPEDMSFARSEARVLGIRIATSVKRARTELREPQNCGRFHVVFSLEEMRDHPTIGGGSCKLLLESSDSRRWLWPGTPDGAMQMGTLVDQFQNTRQALIANQL